MNFEPCTATTATAGSADSGGPASPDARFTLARAPFAGQTFAAAFRVCANPCCPCGAVGFACRPESAPAQALCFDLDIFERQLNTEVQSAPDGVALGRAFISEAQADQWEWLVSLFYSVKRGQMKTMDLNKLEVDLPPDVKAGGGPMVGYAEIFPWAELFQFTHGGAAWFVDDQYCVRPGCDCTQAGLGFFHKPAGIAPPAAPLKCDVFLHYDYRTGKAEVETAQTGSPAPAALVQALRAANPGLAETLRHRHGQLKQLGRRLMHPQSAIGNRQSTIRNAQSAPPSPNVGRNDPCPCGSGKKFKKCCGAA